MGLNDLPIHEVARLNMSDSDRIPQALKVNDLGTAQRIAASVAMGGGHHLKQSLAQTTPRPKDHQVDVLA